MTFEQALTVLKNGGAVRRSAWGTQPSYVRMEPASGGTVNGINGRSQPYMQASLVMKAGDGSLFHWAPNCLHLFADDWMGVPPQEIDR